jgi:hypothetical protein
MPELLDQRGTTPSLRRQQRQQEALLRGISTAWPWLHQPDRHLELGDPRALQDRLHVRFHHHCCRENFSCMSVTPRGGLPLVAASSCKETWRSSIASFATFAIGALGTQPTWVPPLDPL